MTLLGTIIYVPPKDDEPGKFVPIVGEALRRWSPRCSMGQAAATS
jgi:hypothetical protein